MVKRTNDITALGLGIELLKRIPRHQKVTIKQLHQALQGTAFERDERTIARQLKVLCEHFDIECDDSSKPYGFCWKPNAGGLSLLQMSESEALLLELAKRHLNHLLPASLQQHMSGFFDNAQSTLRHYSKDNRGNQWLKKVMIVNTLQPLLPAEVDAQVFKVVSDALYHNHWLNVTYSNAEGDTKTKSVRPLGLAQKDDGRLYLVVRFEGHEGAAQNRQLVLNRIQTAQDTGRTFTPPDDFDLREYDAQGGFGFGVGRRVKLMFCITRGAGQHLFESKLSTDQTIQTHDDYLEITATVVDSMRLNKWLRGFGEEVWKATKTNL